MSNGMITLPRALVERVLIGGNHVALLIGADHPPYTASHDEAREHYRIRRSGTDWNAFEAWCCWRTIMQLRDAFDAVK
jgi:hypothetical protein